jgi:hypothetical protein
MENVKNWELLKKELEIILNAVEIITRDTPRHYLTPHQQFDFADTTEAALIKMVQKGSYGQAVEILGHCFKHFIIESHMLKRHQTRTALEKIITLCIDEAMRQVEEWEAYEPADIDALIKVEIVQQMTIMYKIDIFSRYNRLIMLVIAYIITRLTDWDIQ